MEFNESNRPKKTLIFPVHVKFYILCGCAILIYLALYHEHYSLSQELSWKGGMSTKAIQPVRLQKDLPDFENGHAGGVIIFYHVAKTGGTTLRELFKTLVRESPKTFSTTRFYNPPSHGRRRPINNTCIPPGIRVNATEKMDEKIMDTIRNQRQSKTFLVEIHGTSIGMNILPTYIQKWRQMSKKYNTPFYAFTLVREPVSFSLSYFKFYYCKREERLRWMETDFHMYNDATSEEKFVASTRPNRQCFLLKHLPAIEGLHHSFYEPCAVTKRDCDDIYEKMKDNLDWVGTTESLSKETLPLLMYLIRRTTEVPQKFESHKAKDSHDISLFSGKPPSNNTIESILNLTQFDQEIYTKVKNDFKLPRLL